RRKNLALGSHCSPYRMRYSVPYTVLDFKYRGAVRFNARKRDAADCPCSQTAGLSGATLVMSVRSRPMDTRARPMVQHARRVPLAAFGYGRLGGAASERWAINGLGIRFTPSAG